MGGGSGDIDVDVMVGGGLGCGSGDIDRDVMVDGGDGDVGGGRDGGRDDDDGISVMIVM